MLSHASRDRGADASFTSFQATPLTNVLGAEIDGLSLRAPLTPLQAQELNDALVRYEVVFFRNQPIDHEQHEALGRCFGQLARHSAVAGIDGHPDIVKIHADENATYIAGDSWHSDLSADAEPPLGSILYLHTVPESGGDTLFASMAAAYDALSDRLKTYLDGLTAVHDANPVYHSIFKDYDRRYPMSTHPIVRTHPISKRKGIFVNASYTTHIEGVSKEESKAILNFLYDHIKNPNFQVRFRWQPHSIAIWDNRAVQHMAVWDYFPQVRSGYRVTIAGDAPY